jgi:zinc transport system substrate-binding protein
MSARGGAVGMGLRLVAAVLAGMALAGPNGAKAAEGPNVVATIKPLHSLVAAVMEGIGAPHLIVAGAASPHTYSLKPSDARALERADAVFWIGEGLETFLAGSIAKLAPQARKVALSEALGIDLLPARKGGVWAKEGHGEEARATVGKGHFNLHIWLDPRLAGAMAAGIARTLGEVDPSRAARYQANEAALAGRLDALEREMAAVLEPVRDRPFVVFHDAYPYLERRFGLTAVGSVTLSPERQPGAARVAAIRRAIVERGAICVLAEPGFRPALIDAVVEGTGVREGVIDPLGADLAAGPDLYFALMRRAADSLAECLAASG